MRFQKEAPAGRVYITIRDKTGSARSMVLDTTKEEVQQLLDQGIQSKYQGKPEWKVVPKAVRMKGEKKTRKSRAA